MTVEIIDAVSLQQIETVRTLFIEYQQWLNFSLCFQGFDKELAELPGKYSAPKGRLYLVTQGSAVAGCAALRPMEKEGVCEMKRLFLREDFRGKGVGKLLAERIVADAGTIGYRAMRLDTLQRMEAARALYKKLGFRIIPAYYDNPMGEVVYMELTL